MDAITLLSSLPKTFQTHHWHCRDKVWALGLLGKIGLCPSTVSLNVPGIKICILEGWEQRWFKAPKRHSPGEDRVDLSEIILPQWLKHKYLGRPCNMESEEHSSSFQTEILIGSLIFLRKFDSCQISGVSLRRENLAYNVKPMLKGCQKFLKEEWRTEGRHPLWCSPYHKHI